MRRLGNIILTHPKEMIIGSIHYNEKRGNVQYKFDPVSLLTVCRETEMPELCAYCTPLIEVAEPLFLAQDIQVCLKTKRIKIGWVCTSDSATGHVRYSIRLDVEAILKRLDAWWLHGHNSNVKEDK